MPFGDDRQAALAKRFYKQYILAEESEDDREALSALMHAAWVFAASMAAPAKMSAVGCHSAAPIGLAAPRHSLSVTTIDCVSPAGVLRPMPIGIIPLTRFRRLVAETDSLLPIREGG